jgi:DnaJ-class molecular chaperone
MNAQAAPEGFTPQICIRCDGTKKEESGNTCKGCKGKGFVQVRKPVAECTYCFGTGNSADKSPCIVCGGSGWANTWRG